jgi:hypothetical protein
MNDTATAPIIPNPYNQILAQKHGQVQRAFRFALGTLCDPQGQPIVKKSALRKLLKTIQINATANGDNIIIPALAGIKQIYELVLWNVTGQDITFQQGSTVSNNSIVLLALPGFPSTTGFTLGFNGNWDMSHWDIDNNQALVMTLGGGTRVTGFIRYRVANGSL